MRKNIISKVLTATAIFGASLPAGTVFAAPPVYRSNALDDVMITVIRPSEPYLEIKYSRTTTSTRDINGFPTYFNFQIGEITDYQLHYLYNGQIGANPIIWKGSWVTIKPEGITDGDTIQIKNGIMYSSAALKNNARGIIDYYVEFYDSPQRSRADYRRCVNSSVFDQATMECRMEDLGNGFVQYQPYLLDGTRVEILVAEDAALTKITNEWRAEPGDWGPEWYENDEETGGENNESDEGQETGGNTPVQADTGEGEDTGDENAGDESTGDKSANTDDKSDEMVVETASVIEVASVGTDTVIAEADVALIGASGALVTSQSEQMKAVGSEVAKVEERAGGEKWVANEEETESKAEDENKSEDEGNTKTEEKVGVPNLGKELESQPNWTAIIAIGVASVMGLVGWLSLFFGKKVLMKRKEREK